jgi:hypothetical protein
VTVARLQILQLPEGTGDERPPYLLIVDELPTGDEQLDMLRRDLADNDITARVGARGALCFEGTVTVPANEIGRQVEPLLRVGEFEGDEEILRLAEERDELHAEIGLAHGQLHSAALSAIRGKHATIRELIERAEKAEAERDRDRHRITVADAQISRVRALITERRTEVAEFEAENKPSGWSDAVTVTCDKVSDALRIFPPSTPVPEVGP